MRPKDPASGAVRRRDTDSGGPEAGLGQEREPLEEGEDLLGPARAPEGQPEEPHDPAVEVAAIVYGLSLAARHPPPHAGVRHG
jgi:hypothetical protein